MNVIKQIPVHALGYNFIPAQYIPQGEDEYYLRNHQNRSGITYRTLTSQEVETLVRNNNTSDNWNHVLVSEQFNATLVRNCTFFGLVRIGKLEPLYLEFHSVQFPVGLYNSTIISCDIGDNVVIDNVGYMSHYIIGNGVIIVNVNELVTTNYTKFGNGIVKEGEDESVRIWMELCNENGGRSVIPFSGMLPGDAYLWTRHRTDLKLHEKFKQFTEKQLEVKRGYYGKIGDRTVIKHCKMIKDTWVGSDAYLKGANKIKNVTVNSDAQRMSQIGEGCEIVNGIIGYGCKLFYGVKAVRFVMASHSQLKYGARLINSYLGDNATISCCEVLNSLIFPSHEQHHNNSFLCAALIMGQSNLAAGATIGSNHNSRAADGELIANRGFWPGLCVSLKHNSKFASFTMIAKGDYNYEINNPFPFSLISNQEHNNTLTIMPAYWFMYNMYALARNASKYAERDMRTHKIQLLEFDYLAPDTANELIYAIQLIQQSTGAAWYRQQNIDLPTIKKCQAKGTELLSLHKEVVHNLQVTINDVENSSRTVLLLKVSQAYDSYVTMLEYYCTHTITKYCLTHHIKGSAVKALLSTKHNLTQWHNVGGQLITTSSIKSLLIGIKKGTVHSWQDIRTYYKNEGNTYELQKLHHALATYQLYYAQPNVAVITMLTHITTHATHVNKLILDNIIASRAKDYTNPYKLMTYNNASEMDAVIGKLDDNSFIKAQKAAHLKYKKEITQYINAMV